MGTNYVILDGRKVEISNHAIRRYEERFCRSEDAMRDQLSRAVLFGAQRGDDKIYLDEDVAFVIDRFGVVKTALLKSMLIANMQLAFRGIKYCSPLLVETEESKISVQFIASLAEQHCSSCFPNCFGKRSRKTRNRQLRQLGIVHQSELEKIYHEMFLAAYNERLAEESCNDQTVYAASSRTDEKRSVKTTNSSNQFDS